MVEDVKPRYEVYNKDPSCFLDRKQLRVFRIERAPDTRPERERTEDLELEDLVERVVAALNAAEENT